MKWVKCSERMPEQYDPVIIASYTEVTAAFYQDDGFVAAQREIKNISHWMPFPEPPKE